MSYRRVFACLPALLLPVCGVAAGELPNCPTLPIRFSHYEMGSLYSQGEGIDQELLDEMIRRSGCRMEIVVMPRARIWAELESGSLDMAASAIQTPERDRFAWFAHYLLGKNYVILREEVPASVRSLDDFLRQPALGFGVVRSYKYSPYFDAYLPRLAQNGQLRETVDMGMTFRMLKAGRFQATFGFPYVYPFYLRQQHLEGRVRIVDWDPGPGIRQGIVMSKKSFSEEEARLWRALVDEIRHDGTLEKILRRHMDPADVPATLNF